MNLLEMGKQDCFIAKLQKLIGAMYDLADREASLPD